MKKLWIIPILVVLICVCTVACVPAAGNVKQKGANVFPASTKDDSMDVTMGDVMPF